MVKEIRELLENLRFSEEESKKVMCKNLSTEADQGNEAWIVGRLMTKERVNKKAMYRVFRSLWLTKENVNFVELSDEMFLVKFNDIEDRERILNMAPRLFDQNLFSMVPFLEILDLCEYNFNKIPLWL